MSEDDFSLGDFHNAARRYFDEQPFVRDPELRRAALEVVCRMERLHAGGTDDDFEQLGKAVDALKEALAK